VHAVGEVDGRTTLEKSRDCAGARAASTRPTVDLQPLRPREMRRRTPSDERDHGDPALRCSS
jgi:hypothetical protein